ncbi:MAG: polyribonucleotide nucleotidyltransferase [Planctomycetota bacterium]
MRSVSREIGGRTLTIETGWIAKQTSGSVIVSYGETVVMSTVVDGGPKDLPFFPLTVDYREKTYSAGKIPGGFFKREAAPTLKEVLAMRMLDRSVRPMFAAGFQNEVQVMSAVLSFDQENEPEVLSMIGGMAAIHLSHIPFEGAMGAIRLGYVDGNVIINPTKSVLEMDNNLLDLTMSGTEGAVCMVEAGAKELPDSEVPGVLAAGHEVIKEIIGMLEELRGMCGKDKLEVEAPVVDTDTAAEVLAKYGEEHVVEVLKTDGKFERYGAVDAFVAQAIAEMAPEGDSEEAMAEQKRYKKGAKMVANDIERKMTLENNRVDGRDGKTIRQIDIETSLLPRVHGSTLFTRGETQAIVATTLGSSDDEMFVDGLNAEKTKNKFFLHYNFPPYCTGEAKMLRGTSRREKGHGNLAERALRPMLPDHMDFPYTIRIVSDITESNGSSSMASVCGGCLSMLDAGVPMKAPVAGIAMGLIMDEETGQYNILSDILGSEDHHGDMDFKVTGTEAGITALQMDIKVKGLSAEIMAEAITQAQEGRLHILGKMAEALDGARESISQYAPANKSVKVPKEKIGFVIGPKGANIRELQETYGVNVNILDEEGNVQVSGTPVENVDACIERIRQQTRVIAIGERFNGKVTGVKDFGCFVDLGGGQEGMCHISELASERTEEVSDVCNEGDMLDVIVVNVDERSGKIRLSRRIALLPEEEVEEAIAAAARPARPSGRRDDRGGRGRGRDDRGGRDRDRGGRDRGSRERV